MKKAFACTLALGLLLAFAACGGRGGEAPASVIEAEITTAAPDTATVPETTTVPGEEPSVAAAVSETGVPGDTAGVIQYYNEALGQTPMRRTLYTRTMTKITGFAKALGITILDEPNLQDNPDLGPYVYEEDRATRPSDLVALEPGWVSDAKASVKDSEAVLTITMKGHGLDPNFDPKPGAWGYVSTIDKATATGLVVDASFALADSVIGPIYPHPLREVTVTDAQCGMGSGKYTVVIDTDTGRIKSLTFTGTQQVEGNAKCRLNIPIIPASANAFVTLQGNLVATYAPK